MQGLISTWATGSQLPSPCLNPYNSHLGWCWQYGFIDHLFYLDHNKNVNVEDLGNRSRLCKVISELKPVRDVDWSTSREGHTTLSTNGQALAAHGQRCGDVMTHKEACQYCKAGFGAFQSCVVIWYDGPSSYMKGGSCMNCYFGGRWRGKCSLCKSLSSQDILRSNNVPG